MPHQSQWVILGDSGARRVLSGVRRGWVPTGQGCTHGTFTVSGVLGLQTGCAVPREVRPSPAPSCPPWSLPGVAQSHLPSPAEFCLFTARFCIAVLRNWSVQSGERGIKVLTLTFNYYLYFWKAVAARIKYLVGIKCLLPTFSSCLVCA